MHPYSINLVWSDEDGGYIATIPEFQNLSAFGVTREDALREANVVLNSYIEVCNEAKEALPEPIKSSQFSGQTRLRIPKQLHMKLAMQSAREGVSLNTYMVSLLSMNFAMDVFLANQNASIREVISSLGIFRPIDNVWTPQEMNDPVRQRSINDINLKYSED